MWGFNRCIGTFYVCALLFVPQACFAQSALNASEFSSIAGNFQNNKEQSDSLFNTEQPELIFGPEENKKNFSLKSPDWWMVLLTAGLAVFTGFMWIETRNAARDSGGALEAAKRSAQAAEASNVLNREIFLASERPWLKVGVSIAGPIWYDAKNNGAIHVPISTMVTNVGKSPALNVKVRTHIHLKKKEGYKPPSLEQDQIDLSNELKNDTLDFLEEIIFPGDSLSSAFSEMVSHETLEAATDSHKFLLMYVVGCVDYRFVGAEDHHQTWFLYDVRRRLERGAGVLKWDNIDVPAEQLCLIPSMDGKKFAN